MEPQRDATRVVIFTRDFRIVGNIGLLPGTRLTDYMVETKQFLAVTDAEVTPLTDTGTLLAKGFLNINRDSIQFITPAD